jgi:hypothetical protein
MKNLFFLAVAVVTFIILVLNFLTPYGGDDFAFNIEKSLFEAIVFQYKQYFEWTGRVIGHFMIRVFMMMPKGVFNVFNTLAFTGVTLLIYKLADGAKKFNVPIYLFGFFSLWLYTLEFGQSMLNLTASNVYLWGAFRILCFLLPYSLHTPPPPSSDKRQLFDGGGYVFAGRAGG